MIDPIGSLGRKWRWLRAISAALFVTSTAALAGSFWMIQAGVHTSTAEPGPGGRLFTSVGLGQGLLGFTNRLAHGQMVEGSRFLQTYPLRRPYFSLTLWPKGPWVQVERAPLGDSVWMVSLSLPLWIPTLFFAALGITSHRLATRPRRRLRAGLCPRCAYLLNPQGCTECGWKRSGALRSEEGIVSVGREV